MTDMTDTTTAEGVDKTTTPTEADVPDNGANQESLNSPDSPPTAGEPAHREAAKWRTKYREAESQIAGLAGQLDGMRRREAERLAAATLADGADLWRDGLTVADILDDTGAIDPDKVTAAANTVAAHHHHWRKRVTGAVPTSEVSASATISDQGPPQFADAFKRR